MSFPLYLQFFGSKAVSSSDNSCEITSMQGRYKLGAIEFTRQSGSWKENLVNLISCWI